MPGRMTSRHRCHARRWKMPAASLRSLGRAAGAGDDVEQDVPLGAQDHQGREPDVRIQPPGDDRHHRDREEHVGREGGQELGDRLDPLGPGRPQADPDPDRHPDQAGDGDQHEHAGQGEEAQAEGGQRVVQRQVGARGSGRSSTAAQQHADADDGRATAESNQARRSGSGGRLAAQRDAARRRRDGRSRSGDRRGRAGGSRRVRRKQVEEPGLAARPPRRSARSGTCRPRRRSAGRAAGRRAR